MASNADAPKKKRDHTKDRKRRKQKRQRFGDSDLSSDDEEDVDPDSSYGPRGETKREWDARVLMQAISNDSWAAFERRAKARRGKLIEYERPTFPEEEVLHIAEANELNSSSLMGNKEVRQLSFAPGVNVNESVIEIIANADASFCTKLRAFIAGDPKREKALETTDADIEKFIKACPKLQVVTLQGASEIGLDAFPSILRGCADIEALTVTTRKQMTMPRSLDEFLNWLCDKDFVPKLRFLNLQGLHLDPTHRNFLDFPTKRRPTLEIIFGWTGQVDFIRDMESVPLARVSRRRAAASSTAGAASSGKSKIEVDEDDEEAWETEEEEEDEHDEYGNYYGDDLVSNDPKANAKMLRKLGQHATMSDALGRPLYDFEMDSDYGDYDLDLDSEEDEGLSPQEMRKMLQIMRMMNSSR